MWLAAATGLAAGLGLWLIAGLACLLGALVLALMRRLETRLDLKEPKANGEGGTSRQDG
jgi:putative Mg2+ transporter-C (MgtC) family protein